jgi:hypothetical protein
MNRLSTGHAHTSADPENLAAQGLIACPAQDYRVLRAGYGACPAHINSIWLNPKYTEEK